MSKKFFLMLLRRRYRTSAISSVPLVPAPNGQWLFNADEQSAHLLTSGVM